MTETFHFRIVRPDGSYTVEAGDFRGEEEARTRAHLLNGANYGRACVELFREQDPPDIVLCRVGTRPTKPVA